MISSESIVQALYGALADLLDHTPDKCHLPAWQHASEIAESVSKQLAEVAHG